MFAGSSKGFQKQNSDGSFNVFCYSCRKFICRSLVKMNASLCGVCAAAEEGKPIPPEILRDIEASKMEHANVSALALQEPDLHALGVPKRRLKFAGITGEIISAIGKFALGRHIDPQEQQQMPSAKLARAKRRPRLFSEGIKDDPKPSIGNMQDVDSQLKPKR